MQNKITVDRKLESKRWSKNKRNAAIAGIVVLLVSVYSLFAGNNGASVLKIDGKRITTGKVWRGNFREYIPVDGTVMPGTTVYLDIVQGGMIEKVYVEAGSQVNKGDTLARLSNANLELEYMNRETQLFTILQELQNARTTLGINLLSIKKQMLDMDHEIDLAGKRFEVDKTLFEEKLIARNAFQETQKQYTHLLDQKEILLASYRIDSAFIASQMHTLNEGISRMQRNMGAIQRMLDQLYVIAPLSGQLSAFDAEVGQLKKPGDRLGQIDVQRFYKMKVSLDERYISRVEPGQTAWLEYLGKDYELAISKVFAEVKDGVFSIDLLFKDTIPAGIKRGQNITVRMEFGGASEALMIGRGAFYASSGGNWVYVLDMITQTAQKRAVSIGRQNSDAYELLKGLEEGETVITSSYETYNNSDELILVEKE